MIQPAPPALRNGPCAYGMELEAARRAENAPTLFDDLEEVRWNEPTTEPSPLTVGRP